MASLAHRTNNSIRPPVCWDALWFPKLRKVQVQESLKRRGKKNHKFCDPRSGFFSNPTGLRFMPTMS